MERFWPRLALSVPDWHGDSVGLSPPIHVRATGQSPRGPRRVDTAVKQRHRGAMAQHVGRNPLACQGGTLMPGSTHVFSEQIRDAITTQPSPAGARKHRILRETFPFVLPCAQRRDGVLT